MPKVICPIGVGDIAALRWRLHVRETHKRSLQSFVGAPRTGCPLCRKVVIRVCAAVPRPTHRVARWSCRWGGLIAFGISILTTTQWWSKPAAFCRMFSKLRKTPIVFSHYRWPPKAVALLAATWQPMPVAHKYCAMAMPATWCWVWKWCCPMVRS